MELGQQEKVTTREVRLIDSPFNVADAHARFSPTRRMLSHFIPQLDVLFIEAGTVGQRAADRRGFQAFMTLNGQRGAAEDRYFFRPVYSSSVALEILANSLSSRTATAAVQCPTFDNIPAIFGRNGFTTVPYDFTAGTWPDALPPRSAIVLVSPNNPTGRFLSPAELEAVATRCAEQDGPLVLDASFRLFEPKALFDCAKIIDRSGCEFVIIEDTGKIWPTTDLKLAYLVASWGLMPEIQEVADDILLNVSPFVSLLIALLAGDPQYVLEVRRLIERNRTVLQSRFQNLSSQGLVRFPHPSSRASVDVLQSRAVSGSTVVDELEASGVAALSTDGFWWGGKRDDASEWDEVRIALSRDEAPFDEAVERMAEAMAERLNRE